MTLSTAWLHQEAWQRSDLKQAAFSRTEWFKSGSMAKNYRLAPMLPLAPEQIEAMKQKLPERATW